jgi:hypothetical protein
MFVLGLIEEHGREIVDYSLERHLLPESEEILNTVEVWPKLLHLRRAQLMEYLQRDYDVTFEDMDEGNTEVAATSE